MFEKGGKESKGDGGGSALLFRLPAYLSFLLTQTFSSLFSRRGHVSKQRRSLGVASKKIEILKKDVELPASAKKEALFSCCFHWRISDAR